MNDNYFDLLQVEKGFSIDLEILENNYLCLQQKYHPDQADDSGQRIKFLNISAKLNVAYKTLVNDFARAEYLLFLNNLFLEEVKPIGAYLAFSQQVLEETLEKNEFLENTNDQSQLTIFFENQKSTREKLLAKMHSSFIEANMQNFLLYTYQMKYLDKIISAVQQKLLKHC
jgi:molecular chaperone HscB